MPDCVHIRGYHRPLNFFNRLLLSEVSYNASSVRSGVIIHKDYPVSQWMIIKIGYNVCVYHVVAICNAIDVTL